MPGISRKSATEEFLSNISAKKKLFFSFPGTHSVFQSPKITYRKNGQPSLGNVHKSTTQRLAPTTYIFHSKTFLNVTTELTGDRC